MSYFGTSDLPSMLADFGVPVAWGAISGRGLVDQVDRDLFSDANAQFTGKETIVTIETTRFAGLGEGERISIDGVAHRVIQSRQQGDGALTALMCLPV